MTGCVRSLPVLRCLTFATGLLECLCFAGVLYGWASLVFVLKEDGYFSSLCVNATGVNATGVNATGVNATGVNATGVNATGVNASGVNASGVNATGVNATHDLFCSDQDERFSLVFTIATFLNNFMTLLNGIVFDYFGTTVSRVYGIVLYTAGALMMAFSPALSNLVFPGLSLLAVGGILILITNFQVANLFGAHRSTIITLYNGAFDSSSAVFFIFKLLREVGVSIQACFIFLAACSVIHVLRTFFLFPRKFIPYPLPENYTIGITCGKSKTPKIAVNGSTAKKQDSVTQDNTETKTFRQCVLSWLFALNVLWFAVIQLRHLLFIGTLNPMLQRLTEGEPSLVSQYLNAFAITQLCGVLCAPWNGIIIDRIKQRSSGSGQSEQERDLRAMMVSLFITVLQSVLFSLCAAIPFLPLQYFTFVLQVLNRSFLYGGNAAFISVAFPSCHFGKLFGLTSALSAIVAALQYPCLTLVNEVLDENPLYLNIGLTVLCLLTFVHPNYVYVHCRRLASQPSQNEFNMAS